MWGNMKNFLFFVVIIFSNFSQAAVISPSSEEIEFKYEATFFTSMSGDEVAIAEMHAQHLFGYLHSPALVQKYKINSNTLGIGAPKLPFKLTIVNVGLESDFRQ